MIATLVAFSLLPLPSGDEMRILSILVIPTAATLVGLWLLGRGRADLAGVIFISLTWLAVAASPVMRRSLGPAVKGFLVLVMITGPLWGMRSAYLLAVASPLLAAWISAIQAGAINPPAA